MAGMGRSWASVSGGKRTSESVKRRPNSREGVELARPTRHSVAALGGKRTLLRNMPWCILRSDRDRFVGDENAMRTATFAWSLLLISLTIGSDAQACSVVASYRVPTTLELVEQADAIVLARIVDGGPYPYEPVARMGGRLARLVPFAAIKGDYTGRRIVFDDAMLELPSADQRATPSDPRNLVDANPDAFQGSCNRYVFKPDMIVVAFLKRDGKDFVPFAPPFSRALEDVPNEYALWVKAVRMYEAIAEKPKSLRRKEMRRQRDIMQFELDDPDARLLALELDRALRDVNR